MNKTIKIIGGIAVLIVGSVALTILKEMRAGGIVYGVAAFLFLIAFSRVTGWKYGRKSSQESNSSTSTRATLDDAKLDLLSEKICPKCRKGYDQSWGICLDCQVELVDSDKK